MKGVEVKSSGRKRFAHLHNHNSENSLTVKDGEVILCVLAPGESATFERRWVKVEEAPANGAPPKPRSKASRGARSPRP